MSPWVTLGISGSAYCRFNPKEGKTEMTIYEALKAKLNREPTNAELKADVHRILTEAMIERAEQGKLRHQRKRR